MKKWQIQVRPRNEQFWSIIGETDFLYQAEVIAKGFHGEIRIMHRALLQK